MVRGWPFGKMTQLQQEPRKASATLVLLLLLLPSACRDNRPDETRWKCHVDGDCMNSCALGAVNAHWYRVHESSIPECEDGCANQVAAPPRCVDGSCVAYQRDPSHSGVVRKHEFCTRKPDPERR
jgi:hypothetical protein